MYKYRMRLYWSEPDHAWIVEVPDLPGVVADGETPEQAVAMAQVIIQEWIEDAQEHGEPIPTPTAEPAVR
ncbi:MAG TPA: type II toxin-antitoxin system HicB family antitoxin [Ktedonobacterales bacterium]|nr:type II toxin-antitoxin system HicB family antitoxin [Ktedonobacterales bacterium]